ncbi:hypothetical protein [Haloferula sp.]|uniref:hypothetical protein n=1 Tax=Haloferula sp. TaxID=2497595 RepID=UPI003C78BF92
MKFAAITPFITWILLGAASVVNGEEILIHQGPEFTTPALGVLHPEGSTPGETITYTKEFFVDSKVVPTLGRLDPENPAARVSAVRAIELATRLRDLPNETSVTRLELLSFRDEQGADFDYYLIEFRVDGSTEHRVVLMNELVISPQFRKLHKEAK